MPRELKNIITYQPYVSMEGWRDYTSEGTICGSVGESKQLEGFRFQIEDADGIGVVGNAFIDGSWCFEQHQGEVVGRPGEGKAIQAISLNLFGEKAEEYDIFYNAHVSNIGWIGFCRNGEPCGRIGDPANYRVEAIQMFIAPKNKTWLGVDSLASFQDVTPPPPAPPVDNREIRNFGEDEFKCYCGCGRDVTYAIKVKIQKLRDLLSQRAGHDMPLVITCGFRCPTENARVGGVWDSLHQEGIAVDLYTPGMSNAMVDEIAYCARQVGLGTIRYYASQFVHVQDIYMRDTIGD